MVMLTLEGVSDFWIRNLNSYGMSASGLAVDPVPPGDSSGSVGNPRFHVNDCEYDVIECYAQDVRVSLVADPDQFREPLDERG
jgi:hypothetical protein